MEQQNSTVSTTSKNLEYARMIKTNLSQWCAFMLPKAIVERLKPKLMDLLRFKLVTQFHKCSILLDNNEFGILPQTSHKSKPNPA